MTACGFATNLLHLSGEFVGLAPLVQANGLGSPWVTERDRAATWHCATPSTCQPRPERTSGRSHANFRVMVDSGVDDRQRSRRALVLEAFVVWFYTARAHDDGTVDQIIQEAIAFPHSQPPEASSVRSMPAGTTTSWTGRRHRLPTLVIASDHDIATPPRRDGRRGRDARRAIRTDAKARRTSPSRKCPTSSTRWWTPSGTNFEQGSFEPPVQRAVAATLGPTYGI